MLGWEDDCLNAADVAHRAEPIERLRLEVRVVARDHDRPKALLPTIHVELPASRFPLAGVGQRFVRHHGVRIVFGNGLLVEVGRSAIPAPGDSLAMT